MTFFLAFGLAFMVSLVATPLVRALAIKIGAVDYPEHTRKVHGRPVPRIGGVAIVVAFVMTFLLYFDLSRAFYGLLGGLLILFTVGIVDDIRGLNPWAKLLWQVAAAGVVLAGGIGIVEVTNPLGGVIALDTWRIPVSAGPLAFNILPIANLVSILWLVGMINVVNFLDGLDGLAGGITSIASLVLFLMALGPISGNATVALSSIILLGSILGFLPYNFYPARIFMGDSGAYVIGMLLALLAIYSESKIAVGSLVLGFAVIDAIWVVLRRLLRRQSPFQPDRGHLHHVIFDSGLFSHRQTVLIFYILTIAVASAVLLTSGAVAFAVLISLLVSLLMFIKVIAPRRVKP